MAPAVDKKRKTTARKEASAESAKRSNSNASGSKQSSGVSGNVREDGLCIRDGGGGKEKDTKQSQKTSFRVVVRGGGEASSSNAEVPSNIELEGSGNVSMETSENPSREWFEKCRKNGLMTNDKWMSLDLDRYVRNDLFPTLKFFMDKKQLNYTTDETSICWQICTEMELKKDRAEVWWNNFKGRIVKILNAKRNDVISAIKRNFMSK